MFTSSNVSGEYSVSVCVYIVSEVCSEWMHKKLFVYVSLQYYAVQSMTPHTGCMIVLVNYINVFLLPPLHILFASNDCLSAASLLPAVMYPRSEPHHC